MTIEYPGNVLYSPNFTKGSSSVDDELLYSTAGFTQKGVTLKGGQGVLLLGTVLGRKTGDKKYYKYADDGSAGVTNEVQSVTEGGAGLTSFTLTYSGQTTGSIAAAATAATVQTALEALSNIAVGDVVVTGPTSGPYIVTFQGLLADTNVAAMTATPTGGSGTVTIATVTGGNTGDGTDTAKGFLRQTVDTGTDTSIDFQANIVISGLVKYAQVNTAGNYDSAAATDLNGRTDSAMGYIKI